MTSAAQDVSVLHRPISGERKLSEAAAVRRSLAELAGLDVTGLGLVQVLEQVALFAARGVPGADGVAVSLFRARPGDNRVQAVAASAAFVAEIDAIQFTAIQEGPTITATSRRRAARSGSLGGEKLWPRFGPRVGRLGVHSVLALPLLVPDQDRVVGALSVYARAKDAFDDHASTLGQIFAAPAAVAVHNAQVLDDARMLAGQLQAALSSRPVIDQAIGLLRGRSGDNADQAFARLRAISQGEHTKLAVVAQRIVDESVRRAQARRREA
jgi:hypothetical protein